MSFLPAGARERFSRWLHTSARLGLVVLTTGLIGASIGCTTAQERGEEGLPLSPNSRAYAYFVINGMARGAMISGHLTRQELPALVQIDQQTRQALEENMRHPNVKTDFRMDQILVRYLNMIPTN